MSAARQLERLVELFQFRATSHELRQSARRRHLQPRPERTDRNHLVHVDRIADALDSHRAQRLQIEVAGREFLRLLGDDDRSGRRERLHPRRQAHRMPNRRVLGMRVVGANRSHHNFAGIEPDPNLDRRTSLCAQPGRIFRHVLLQPQRRVESALRMILMRDRRTEQRKNPVAGGLHDVPVVAMHRVDHQLQRRIDNRPRLFRIEPLHQIHRPLDIGKQRRNSLALTPRRIRSILLEPDANRRLDHGRRSLRASDSFPSHRQRPTTFPAKFKLRRILQPAPRTLTPQRSPTPAAKFHPRRIFSRRN